ncbi:MAG: hypothetical protein GDA41_03175 [Rhodospirillales bacterium]|nr:hypothetical protein [Rhodospirillales bacterium]
MFGVRATTAAYVLYASEAFRTKHQHGAWTWATVEQPIGVHFDQFDERAGIITDGFNWWQRPLRRTETQTQYMFSVVVEGGFPEALIHHEAASVRRWLTLLLADAKKYGLDSAELEDVATQHARSYLPASLCHDEIYHLGAELVDVTRSLREHLGPLEEFADPILRLNECAPGWDNQLPVRLSDQAARELVRGLVRQRVQDQGGGSLGAFIRRVLVNDGLGHWTPAVRLSLAGEVSSRRLPHSIQSMIGTEVLRVRLQGNAAFGSVAPGELSIGERREEDRWAFRPMRYRDAAIPLPLEESVEMTARVGNQVSDPFVVPGGERLDGEIQVFLKDAETGELVHAGSGSLQSRAASIWVAFDDSAVSLQVDAEAVEPRKENLRSPRLNLIEVTAPATFDTSDGLVVRVVPGAEKDRRRRLIIFGKPPSQISSQTLICVGWPTLLFEGGINVPTHSIRWRPVGRRQSWTILDRNRPPVGAIDIAVVVNEELQASARAIVLPDEFRLEVSARGAGEGSLHFYGLEGAEIWVEQCDDLNIQPRRAESVYGLDIASPNAPPSHLTIDIRFPTGATGPMSVPFPGNRVGFITADGSWIERSYVPYRLDQLAGLRASAPLKSLLFAKLLAVGRGQNLSYAVPVQGLVSIAAHQSEFEALLSESDDLDAHIRLELENARIELGRFDLSLETSGTRNVHLAAQSVQKLRDEGAERVEILTADLTDLIQSPNTLGVLSSANLTQMTSVPISASPILLWGEVRGRPRTRPIVIPPQGKHERAEEPFVACVLLSDKNVRLAAMVEHLEQIAADPLDPDWKQFDAALRTYKGKLSLTILDWLVALSADPKALVAMLAGRQDRRSIEAVVNMEDELPFCWCLVPSRFTCII